jgi:hypothetical protein
MIWREKQWLLIILGLLLAANTIFFFTYRVRYEQRLQDFESRQEEAQQRLDQARFARQSAERQLASYRKIENDVREIYDVRWATQAQRLASLITEVKRLAVASQLVPKSYSFSRAAPKMKEAKNIDATQVGISFMVEGNYQQVRQLINRLEGSRQFVILDQITLNSGNNQMLTLNLQVKTLFRGAPQEGSRNSAL